MRRFLFPSLLLLIALGLLANPSSAFAQMGGTPTVQDIVPVTTATPQPDGSIVHEVQYGQTLWMIADAYGVDRAELITLNNLTGNNPVLWVGQKLIIRLAPTPTTTPSPTSTLRPPTRTPTLVPTPITPTPTHTLAPTRTPTPRPLVPNFRTMDPAARRGIGISFLVISGLGLLAVFYFGFRKK